MRSGVLLLTVIGCAFAVCPPDSTRSSTRRKCFTFVDQQTSFFEAQAHCETLGGHLASVADELESETVVKVATAKKSTAKFWIGVTHNLIAGKKNHKNVWLDGTVYNYTKWREGVRCVAKECISVQTSDGRWTTVDCERTLPFVCITNDDDQSCPTVTCPAAPNVTCPISLPLTTTISTCPTVICAAVTCPTVKTTTCPTIPSVTTPKPRVCPTVTCQNVTCPTVPIVTCPACPTAAPVTPPTIPTVTCPDCPTVTCPTVACPTVPKVTCPNCPTAPALTCPTAPVITCPTTPSTPPVPTCPTCPTYKCPPPPAGQDCPTGFMYFRETHSCYTVLTAAKLNHTEAEEECVKLGAHLTSIHSLAENTFVNQIAHLGIPLYALTDHIWIGLHRDLPNRAKFVWTDGTPYDYKNWYGSNPDDYGMNEACIQMYADTGYGTLNTWNDYTCSMKLRASICKRPA